MTSQSTLQSIERPGRLLALFVAAVMAVLAAYLGGLTELVIRWERQEEYSHGFFIPLIAAWFLWQRRDALRNSIGKPAWVGIVLLLVALGMLVLGEVTAIYILVQYGFLLALVSLVLCLGGMPLAKVSLLPIAFLIFAIPLPYFVDSQLSWRLQLLSSRIGVEVLRLLGASVFLEGNVIDLGVYRLQVVDACSGLRYLYPLLSIGFLMAYMYQGRLWQRVVLFLSTVPITVFMNSLRIAAVGVLVGHWGSGMAEGFLHYFEGWVIFMACLLFLLAEVWLFERLGARRRVLSVVAVPTVKGGGRVASFPALPRHPLSIALMLLVVTGIVVQVVGHREEIKPQRLPLSAYPLAFDGWQATEGHLDTQIEIGLGLSDYVLADYRRGEDVVNFYAAYYSSQRKGVSPHSPQVCIPGGGWLITSLTQVPVPLPDGSQFTVNRVLISREGQRQLVYYWFEERGRRIASEYAMKWYLLVDALLRNRSDGALVRITTPIGQLEKEEVADRRLQTFMTLAVPRLAAYVPR